MEHTTTKNAMNMHKYATFKNVSIASHHAMMRCDLKKREDRVHRAYLSIAYPAELHAPPVCMYRKA